MDSIARLLVYIAYGVGFFWLIGSLLLIGCRFAWGMLKEHPPRKQALIFVGWMPYVLWLALRDLRDYIKDRWRQRKERRHTYPQHAAGD